MQRGMPQQRGGFQQQMPPQQMQQMQQHQMQQQRMQQQQMQQQQGRPGMPPQQQGRPGMMPQQQGMPTMAAQQGMPTQGDHLMMAKMQRQGQRGGPPMGALGGASPDFLARLERAEVRDSQRDMPAASASTGITVDNWEQRSRNIGRLALQNEAAEIAAKQRMGLLPPGPSQAPPPQQQRALPGGYSQSQANPNFRDAMQAQRLDQQAHQQAQMMAQRNGGMQRGGQPQKLVALAGSYDQWDDRVPAFLASGGGGKVMNGREARQQSRGQSSSIVFG